MSYFEQTRVTNTSGVAINPAEEESITLLKRIVKLLESNAVVDVANRQRITVEVLPTLATVTTVSSITNLAAWGGVDPRYSIMDTARNTYANGIRKNLTFT